ncbi:MAG: hypothetical protein KIT29_06540 [Anaerolineales bacterium]|jgi:hypothetical protein|nr:hypothetical protein [Anaerolineales bacterium]MCW5839557.1 hypothetical protein [Anaerolineales bacterium]
MDYQRFLTDGLPQLTDYLQSDDVFWLLDADPQLTLGNVLLAEASLQAEGKLRPEDRRAIAEAKRAWPVLWRKKAEREFAARLRQWSHYLAELADKPKQHALYYANEVRPRVLMQLLGEAAPELAGKLPALDAALKPLVQPSEFIWDAKLADTFPAAPYWFLRVKPTLPDEDEK